MSRANLHLHHPLQIRSPLTLRLHHAKENAQTTRPSMKSQPPRQHSNAEQRACFSISLTTLQTKEQHRYLYSTNLPLAIPQQRLTKPRRSAHPLQSLGLSPKFAASRNNANRNDYKTNSFGAKKKLPICQSSRLPKSPLRLTLPPQECCPAQFA